MTVLIVQGLIRKKIRVTLRLIRPSISKWICGALSVRRPVGRLSQNGDLVIGKQCGDTRDCESACRH
jgi:hypothetical protein